MSVGLVVKPAIRGSEASARIPSRSAPSAKIFTSRSSITRSVYSLGGQKQPDGGSQVGGGGIRRGASAPFVGAWRVLYNHRPAARSPARLDVAVGVSDHPGRA